MYQGEVAAETKEAAIANYLDKPQFTRVTPRLQVQFLLLTNNGAVCAVCGCVPGGWSPVDQDGIPTLAFTCKAGECEEVAAERAVCELARDFLAMILLPRFLVRLGTVSGATGVYVRNYVFWYSDYIHPGCVILTPVWDPGHIEWLIDALPPHHCTQHAAQLQLLWGYMMELLQVQRMWEGRGFGTFTTFAHHGRGRGRGRRVVRIWYSYALSEALRNV